MPQQEHTTTLDLPHRVSELVHVHHGLRAALREGGDAVERYLLSRGWRCDGDGWRLVGTRGFRRSLDGALAFEAALDLGRWLRGAGWRVLPDGSSASSPSRRGLVLAARVEHRFLARGSEVLA